MKAAVIGLGGMGRRHVAALALAGIEPALFCDARLESARDAAQGLDSCPACCADWREALDRGGFEILVVATNGPSHHEIVLAAAAARVPYILCEKPLTTSAAKAREMLAACRDSGSRLGVNLVRRFLPLNIELRRTLAQGAIGEPRHLHLHIGAGGLGCVGTHYFDFPSWLFGVRPQWVTALLDRNPAPNVRGAQFFDPGGQVFVGYENGITAFFELSGDVTRHSRGEIGGTKGFVSLDDLAQGGMAARIQARPAERWDEAMNRYVPLAQGLNLAPCEFEVVRSSAACLTDLLGSRPEDTAQAAVDALDVVMAAHLSHQRGPWSRVDLPLTGADLHFDVPIT